MDKKADALSVQLYQDKDWYCPYCKDLNHTERPGKTVQCSWCMKKSIVNPIRLPN